MPSLTAAAEPNDAESILLLYWKDWIKGPEGAPITPEIAAGDCIRLWGSAREALAARARLSDRWARQVNELLMEAAGDG